MRASYISSAEVLWCFPAHMPRVVLQYKTSEVAARCKSLMRVNIYKNRIKNAAHLPALPNAAGLAAALSPSFWALSSIGREKARFRPLYSITDDQRHAADSFLQVSPAVPSLARLHSLPFCSANNHLHLAVFRCHICAAGCGNMQLSCL
jgi:hypothetical protein